MIEPVKLLEEFENDGYTVVKKINELIGAVNVLITETNSREEAKLEELKLKESEQ